MLAGRPLFPGKSDLDQLFMHGGGPVVHDALGPLTPRQAARCLDLTGFVRFPEVAERQTLAKRLGRAASEEDSRTRASCRARWPWTRPSGSARRPPCPPRGCGSAPAGARTVTGQTRRQPEAPGAAPGAPAQLPPARREASQDPGRRHHRGIRPRGRKNPSWRSRFARKTAPAGTPTGRRFRPWSPRAARWASRAQRRAGRCRTDGVAPGGPLGWPTDDSAASTGESPAPAQREICEESIEEDGVVHAVSSDRQVGESLAPVEDMRRASSGRPPRTCRTSP
ncbi:unnamed protein product [Prorocentrum cordatum]|uniref:Protein kinase domain-containing protein n=1 Tax=Prorocentrum cordatum TaxID=2364126 RepID=A0ABN9UFZ5_9DINO|nr:unnamed protein product [Polarella glacialis]